MKPFSFRAGFVCFLLLFLGFNFSATASRSFVWPKKNEVALQDIHFQDEIETRSYQELDESMTRRIDLESTTDYGGTGANDHHDPNTPGGVFTP